MKKAVAITGVVLLVIMCILTLILAITDSSPSMGYFKASMAATILIPIFLYIYIAVYKFVHRDEIELKKILDEEKKSDK